MCSNLAHLLHVSSMMTKVPSHLYHPLLKAWLSLKKAGLLIKPMSIIMILVKNASGTSRWTKPSTGESSWLEYWEKRTGKKATQCGATDCHSKYNLIGAHVKKVYGGDELYITPLCTSCNQRSGNFYVDTELVRVPNGQ